MNIDVLGTKYEIIVKKLGEEEVFERLSVCGFCDEFNKEILVCDPASCEGWEHAEQKIIDIARKEIIRHEIIHAFLIESGLGAATTESSGGWAKNEEMIDWFAVQGLKIYTAWREAGAA
jgi:hypothetical protein